MRGSLRASTLVLALAVGCTPKAEAPPAEPAPVAAAPAAVSVVASEYELRAPEKIAPGWTTFEFRNEGQETHFFLLTLLPEGKTLADYANEVGPPFQKAWDELLDGASKAAAGTTLGKLLPAWYADAKVMGGAGLLAPGHAVRVTLDLIPGTYAMECYQKTPEGVFHGAAGMLRSLVVEGAKTATAPPAADVHIAVRNAGYQVSGALTPGPHVVAVHFEEQPAAGLGNDVHLVRLGDTPIAEVVPWMDWMNVDGMRSPAPAEFLGGVEEVPAGKTAYFGVDLEPGHYAWIGESGAERGLVQEFTVTAGS